VTQPIHTRTQVVSFLFIDLVAFSKESTASQHQIKTVLIQHLGAALAPIPVSEYRLRDTGDGAFVAFWSNPEFALYTALALWQACSTDSGSSALPRQRLRVGLHIGTVKETPDVEGRINYVGDGINAAKRIQDLAEPGQILASRSFFDAFDHLDADYSSLFTQCGSGDDKHGRSYELFSLSFGDAALAKLSQEIEQHTSSSRNATTGEQKKTDHPKWAAFFPHKPITWLSLGLGLTLFVAVYFVKEPDEPPKDSSPAQSAAKVMPVPKIATSTSPTIAVAPPAAASDPMPAPVSSPATPGTLSSGKTRPPPARVDQGTHNAKTGKLPGVTNVANPRCTSLLQKAGTGEPLSSQEQKEMVSTCQ
jgi:hypothetical protein